MEYFTLPISVLTSADFRRSSLAERGTWVTLLAFCAQHENGGVIAGFAEWTEWDRMQVLGLPQSAFDSPASRLWHLLEADGSLIVSNYPAESQRRVTKQRMRGRFLNAIRWAKSELSELESAPDSEAKFARMNELQRSISAAQSSLNSLVMSAEESVLNVTERKVRVKKGKGNAPGSAGSAPVYPPDIHQRMLAVNGLKGRRESTTWSKKEAAAFNAAGLRDLTTEAWQEQILSLTTYYGAPIAALRQHWGKDPAGSDDFRRRDLLTLMNNWAGEVDRARAFEAWQEKKDTDGAAGRL